MKKIFLNVFALVTVLAAQAQVKEGSISYDVKFEGIPAEYASFVSGSEMKVYFKDKKSRSEFSTPMMTRTTFSDENTSTTLMEQNGQKIYFKRKKEDIEKEMKKMPEPKVTFTDEKKTIAGYECKKAIVESKDEKGEIHKAEFWCTDKIEGLTSGGKMNGAFKGQKGAALEFKVSQGPRTMQFIATNVSTSPIPDAKLLPSTEGYTETTYEDFKKMMSAMGGSGN
ncbi:MAG TPA: DUF4412 domain-containing protein [Bacteroidia bacterium]|jgi:hypothetical protein|nr:DUF4412 domain-containing protein [Bacteroidia bacterium]